MEKLSPSPTTGTLSEEADDERTNEEKYLDIVLDVKEVSREAQRVLEMKYVKPEHTLQILGDCFDRIEDLCGI